MPDDKQGVIHSFTDGGTIAKHPDPEPSQLLVAPSSSSELNTAHLRLLPIACFCLTDMRFMFDSSFVLPEIRDDMSAFSLLRKTDTRVMGAPLSIFGHADPSYEGNFAVGSSTSDSGDDYNKTLSGRRAIAIYALLVRDASLWNNLYTNHLGTDVWGDESIRTMLNATGQSPADGMTVANIANSQGQRQQLFLGYMNSLCGDLKLDKSADFLARGAGADQKGDVQGCSRFNPLLLFSSEDEALFKQAFADKDEPTLRDERDPRNAVNRRVMILIFRKGSQVLPSKWPCPTYKEGKAGCKKRAFSDGDKRRSTHTSGAERKFELTQDTFSCRFYQRISQGSPCNSTAPPPPLVHAALAIKELTFSGGHSVEKDTLGNFPSPEWLDSRSQADQSPISYKKNTKIQLTAKFKVTTQPSSTESVDIKGDATFGSATLQWTGTVSVSPTATEVTISASSAPLPDQVDCFEAQDITWQMNPAGAGWAAAGTTRNIVYVTLGDPTGTPNYWTLLDISCRAARGDSSPASLVSHVFTPLSTRSITRKRDGHALTYWNPPTTRATNTQLLLAAADGSGQCGSWSEFLLDMYKVHGISNADKILIQRDSRRSLGFLVKNWRFNHPPPSSASSLTHLIGSECVELPGIPGQTNPNPPPAFVNHFIVRFSGQFYDPSYGAGPFSDQLTWERAAIDGLRDTTRAGFDKSLNLSTKLLEFTDLTTGSTI
jgi:hypothetical protein